MSRKGIILAGGAGTRLHPLTKVLRQDVNFSFRTAAKLAAALKMDFFPELRPKDENAPPDGSQRADSGSEDC